MKTFSEACKMFVRGTSPYDMTDPSNPYQELILEAAHSPELESLLTQIWHMLECEAASEIPDKSFDEKVDHAHKSLFIYGMLVGMEMEKP